MTRREAWCAALEGPGELEDQGLALTWAFTRRGGDRMGRRYYLAYYVRPRLWWAVVQNETIIDTGRIWPSLTPAIPLLKARLSQADIAECIRASLTYKEPRYEIR